MSEQVRVAVIYYSSTGTVYNVAEATAEDILWADAVIFGSPTRFGNIASQLKQFIDTLGGPWMQGQLADKVYSGESSWVTGQNFCIDGGVTAGYR
jgi:NAD(P)H-dependent FMN reductase